MVLRTREQNLATELSVERRKFHDAQLRHILYVFAIVWIDYSFFPSFCIFLSSQNDSSRSNDFNSDLGFRRSKSLQTMILWSNGSTISTFLRCGTNSDLGWPLLPIIFFYNLAWKLERLFFPPPRMFDKCSVNNWEKCGRIVRLWLLRTRGTRFLVCSWLVQVLK